MAIQMNKIEFELKIRKYRDKNADRNYSMGYREEEKPDFEVYEELNFKTLTAKEVLRKLIDYLTDL